MDFHHEWYAGVRMGDMSYARVVGVVKCSEGGHRALVLNIMSVKIGEDQEPLDLFNHDHFYALLTDHIP